MSALSPACELGLGTRTSPIIHMEHIQSDTQSQCSSARVFAARLHHAAGHTGRIVWNMGLSFGNAP